MKILDLQNGPNPLLLEVASDRSDILTFASELEEAVSDLITIKEQMLVEGPFDKLKDAGGKVAAAAKRVNDVINQAGQKLQQTQPVQDLDAKFDKLRTDLLNKHPKAKEVVDKLGAIAKENPKKSAFVIGALAGLSGFAAGPVASMAIGAGLRAAVGVAQGEKLSTTVGKATKLGVLSTIAGAGASAIADALSGVGQAAIDFGRDMVEPVSDGWLRVKSVKSINGQTFSFNGIVSEKVNGILQGLKAAADNAEPFSPEWQEATSNYLAGMDAVFNNEELQAEWADKLVAQGAEIDKRNLMKDTVKQVGKMVSAIGAAAAGGAAAAVKGKPGATTQQGATQAATQQTAQQSGGKPNFVNSLQRLDDRTFQELAKRLNAGA